MLCHQCAVMQLHDFTCKMCSCVGKDGCAQIDLSRWFVRDGAIAATKALSRKLRETAFDITLVNTPSILL